MVIRIRLLTPTEEEKKISESMKMSMVASVISLREHGLCRKVPVVVLVLCMGQLNDS